MESMPLYAVDWTVKEQQGDVDLVCDPTPFTTHTIPDGLLSELREQNALVSRHLRRYFRPAYSIVSTILIAVGLSLLCIVIGTAAGSGLSLRLLIERVGWVAAVGILLTAVGFLLHLRWKRGLGQIEEDSDIQNAAEWRERIEDRISAALCLPDESLMTDTEILAFCYKQKNGDRIEYRENGAWENTIVRVWLQDDCFCLTDMVAVMKIPLSAVDGFNREEEPYTIAYWFKDEAVDSPTYAPYNIQSKQNSLQHTLDTYYRLDILAPDGALFHLCIPAYEWPVFAKLLKQDADA